MRIGYTHAHCWPDVQRGGERFLHELAGAMARRGHDVSILSSSITAPGRTVDEDGVRIVRLRRPADHDDLVERWFGPRILPRLLRDGFDVTHSMLPADALAAVVAKRLGRVRRTVYTQLGIPDRALWAARHDRRWHDALVPRIDDYGCFSETAAAAARTSYGREPVLTPAGVSLRRFRPGAAKSEHPTLLFVGAFADPMKNLGVLLAAFVQLLRRHPDVGLLLAGHGDVAPFLADVPDGARERISIVPAGTELADEYSRAWATVIPSKWESFGIAFVESLACGTPIVAADHSAARERVVPGAGVLSAPDDPDALADACESVLDLASRPGTAERCRAVAAPFDWDALAPYYERLYAGESPRFEPKPAPEVVESAPTTLPDR